MGLPPFFLLLLFFFVMASVCLHNIHNLICFFDAFLRVLTEICALYQGPRRNFREMKLLALNQHYTLLTLYDVGTSAFFKAALSSGPKPMKSKYPSTDP